MSEDRAKPRHKPDAGYACGDGTRRRIINAAIQLFGVRGFEGASTRDIAKLAEVNAPALQYYFNNKSGLYQACAEHLAEICWARFGPAQAAAQAVLDAGAPREVMIEALGGIQDAFVDHLFASSEAQDCKLFIAQDQGAHGPSMFYEIFERDVRPQLDRVCLDLLARITGMDVSAPLSLLRLMAIHGQLAMFYIAQRALMTSLQWDCIDADRLSLLKQLARTHAGVLIDSWSVPLSDSATPGTRI
jgi:TetR/AcrR family transcriptional regulator, regulator of cefoperazone and chloramphenicol sensitivity